jgi:uncharacterized protein YpmS
MQVFSFSAESSIAAEPSVVDDGGSTLLCSSRSFLAIKISASNVVRV